MRKPRNDNIEVLYLAVTPDEFELPMCVSDSLQEIADWYKVTKVNVMTSIIRGIDGKKSGRKFIRIEVEKDV